MKHTDLNRKLADIFEDGCLPTMVYITLQNHNRKTISRLLHRHESVCELLLVYEGRGMYHIEGKSYLLQAGDVIFYNQGDLHELESDSDVEIGAYCIGLSNLHIRGLDENCIVKPEGPFVCHSVSLFPTLLRLCEQIYHLEDGGTESQISAQLLCSALIIMCYSLTELPATFFPNQQDEKLLLDIQHYLDCHYTEDFSLNTIAEALNCSATHISHIFRKTTGSTPLQYVIRRRIGQAQTLLISTDYTATQIATMVGYDNTNYFSTQFSKIVGMSPARYREFYSRESKGRRDQF